MLNPDSAETALPDGRERSIMTLLFFLPASGKDGKATPAVAAMIVTGTSEDGVLAGDCDLSKYDLWSVIAAAKLAGSGSAPLPRMPLDP